VLDDLFLSDNLRTLQDAAMRPPPVPKQAASFSAWRTTTALPRGVVAGGVQAGSGMADVLGAFGETLGATGTASSRGMFSVPTADERQQADAAAKKLREQGASFALGDPGRRFADEFKPDPETAHTAERLVFDFARVASKAVGYVATSGGLPGALMTGADEGLTVADELKQQGVDLATRTKVGAVVGGVTALGVGLPMAGNTLAQTAGLVALGGPVSFMAQQQAVRSILEAADYTKLAEQYDPLDPVGLAVSTLIPVGFGAWGLRAAKARQAREATEAAARAEAEFAAGPVPSERTAVADAVRAATDEQVDAARVLLAVERRQAGNPGRADDLGAQQAHETALARAEEQMARGERVAVDDVAPRFEADPFATTRLVLPEAADVADQLRGMGEGAFWAVEGGRLLRSGTDTPGDGGMGGEVVGRTSWVPADEWFGRMRNDMGASGLSNQKEIKAAIEKAIEGQPLNAKERRTIDWMRGEIRDMEAKLWELDDADQAAVDAFGHGLSSRDAGDFALTARAAEIDADAVERAAIRFENDDAGFMAEMRRIADGQDRQAAGTADQPGAGPGARGAAAADPPPADARGPGPEQQQPARPDAATGGAATAEARLVDDATARQADALLAEQPDMLVMLDGMDAPRRLSEVLADIKAEADEMRLDGELLQVAAQCALQNGA
jgi:hypothetical protein